MGLFKRYLSVWIGLSIVADQNDAVTRTFDVTATTPHPFGITPSAGAWRNRRDQLHHQGCDPPPNSGGPWQLAHRNLSYIKSEAAEAASLISPETASGGPCLPSSKSSAPLLVSSTLEPGRRACAIFCAACLSSSGETNIF